MPRRSLKDTLASIRSGGDYMSLSKIPHGATKTYRFVPFRIDRDNLPKEVRIGEIILDERVGLLHPFYVFFKMHYGFEQDGHSKSYRCLEPSLEYRRQMARKKGKKIKYVECPFCEYTQVCRETGDEDDDKIARDIRVQTKALINAVDMDTNKLVILTITQVSVLNRLDELIEDFGNLAHPKKGRCVRLRKAETVRPDMYQLSPLPDPAPIPAYKGRASNLIISALQTERLNVEDAREVLVNTYGPIDEWENE